VLDLFRLFSGNNMKSSSSSKRRRRVFVIGVGMIPISQAGKGSDWPEMGRKALENALEDAGLSFHQIQFGAVGYNYGDPTCGQRIISEFGMNVRILSCSCSLNSSSSSSSSFSSSSSSSSSPLPLLLLLL
jgi:sterol carrier protein 2